MSRRDLLKGSFGTMASAAYLVTKSTVLGTLAIQAIESISSNVSAQDISVNSYEQTALEISNEVEFIRGNLELALGKRVDRIGSAQHSTQIVTSISIVDELNLDNKINFSLIRNIEEGNLHPWSIRRDVNGIESVMTFNPGEMVNAIDVIAAIVTEVEWSQNSMQGPNNGFSDVYKRLLGNNFQLFRESDRYSLILSNSRIVEILDSSTQETVLFVGNANDLAFINMNDAYSVTRALLVANLITIPEFREVLDAETEVVTKLLSEKISAQYQITGLPLLSILPGALENSVVDLNSVSKTVAIFANGKLSFKSDENLIIIQPDLDNQNGGYVLYVDSPSSTLSKGTTIGGLEALQDSLAKSGVPTLIRGGQLFLMGNT